MSKRFLISLVTAASVVAVLSGISVLSLAPSSAAAQTNASAAKAKWARDFSGVWSPGSAGFVLPGEEVSLTKFGAEQYNKIDEADSPAYKCEPHGPTRMMLANFYSLRIFQQEDVIGIISEHINDGYRIIKFLRCIRFT
jgi:hypothetical protein